MKIQTITYRRTKNLGNYESETVEATAQVDQEDPDKVMSELRRWVLTRLDLVEISDIQF